MNTINAFTPSHPVNFKAQIPLSKYKGPILNLTADDKQLIKKYQNEISKLELEIVSMKNYSKKGFILKSKMNTWEDKIQKLEAYIKEFQNLIRQIKIDRLNIQKLALK